MQLYSVCGVKNTIACTKIINLVKKVTQKSNYCLQHIMETKLQAEIWNVDITSLSLYVQAIEIPVKQTVSNIVSCE